LRFDSKEDFSDGRWTAATPVSDKHFHFFGEIHKKLRAWNKYDVLLTNDGCGIGRGGGGCGCHVTERILYLTAKIFGGCFLG
jgi:hypothetical protein